METKPVAPSNDDVKRAENGILEILEHSGEPFPPVDLMGQLERKGISEYSARVAIWYLIDRNLIELTMDRLLRFVPQHTDSTTYPRAALAGG
jgi:hypothetical protein